MIVKLNQSIWYGDKPSVTESLGEVQSVINVAHSIRRPYWQELKHLDWRVWYYRLALPDREEATLDYIHALERALDSIQEAGKFPLLCHCRAGGHRGPTAAFFACWHLGGRVGLDQWLALMDKAHRGFSTPNPRRVYRRTILDYCRAVEEER